MPFGQGTLFGRNFYLDDKQAEVEIDKLWAYVLGKLQAKNLDIREVAPKIAQEIRGTQLVVLEKVLDGTTHFTGLRVSDQSTALSDVQVVSAIKHRVLDTSSTLVTAGSAHTISPSAWLTLANSDQDVVFGSPSPATTNLIYTPQIVGTAVNLKMSNPTGSNITTNASEEYSLVCMTF